MKINHNNKTVKTVKTVKEYNEYIKTLQTDSKEKITLKALKELYILNRPSSDNKSSDNKSSDGQSDQITSEENKGIKALIKKINDSKGYEYRLDLFEIIYNDIKHYKESDYLKMINRLIKEEKISNEDVIRDIKSVFSVASKFKDVNINLKFSWLDIVTIKSIISLISNVTSKDKDRLNTVKNKLKTIFKKVNKSSDKEALKMVTYRQTVKAYILEINKSLPKTKVNNYKKVTDLLSDLTQSEINRLKKLLVSKYTDW